jgi:hypothetical protein
MQLTAYDAAITASLLMGVVMVVSSFVLLYKGKMKLDAAHGEAETSIEFSRIKISTHYPAVALFLIGGMLIGYPLYLSSQADARKLVLHAHVLITPSEDLSDVKISLTSLGDASAQIPNSDGSASWEFSPALRQVRVDVTAPGRKMVSKLVALATDGSEVDAGDIQVPDPELPASVLSGMSADISDSTRDTL